MDIEEKKKYRFLFLQRLYQKTDGNIHKGVYTYEIGQELNLDNEVTDNIVSFLKGEYLIEGKTRDRVLTITHRGVLEIEEAIEHPEKPTKHFLPINIISVQNMYGSSIQQGSPNAFQSNSYKNENTDSILLLVEEIKKAIDIIQIGKEEKDEALSELETIIAQSKSPKPKFIIINESLRTIKTLLEGVAVNAYTPIILEKINILLNQ
ncbi:hypothetical protein Q0590_22405 [Rhodocytophaga aerolata]|uniref:MarR family transcriptional regulator n=1 Tax=Rhodocytophaga aerolata TaxID=455078 RepID=A0ABT8RAE8_9BACT|nr:hypothetical protein [Rhodocytophaga aerolata]MDO1449047.1 hypothetical protein [Rhodocytophaga aerolata]